MYDIKLYKNTFLMYIYTLYIYIIFICMYLFIYQSRYSWSTTPSWIISYSTHKQWFACKIFYLFFLPVRLPSKIQKLPPDPPVRGFPGVWKLPLLRLPSRNGSPSLALLSLFLSFIFCPTSFRRQWAAFLGAWCPLLAIRSYFVQFAQCSNVLLMNL